RLLADKPADRRAERRRDLPHDQDRRHLLTALHRRQHADADAGSRGQRFQRQLPLLTERPQPPSYRGHVQSRLSRHISLWRKYSLIGYYRHPPCSWIPTMSAHPHHSAGIRSRVGQFVIGAGCATLAIAIWAGWLVVMRLGVTTRLSAPDLTALRFATAGLV